MLQPILPLTRRNLIVGAGFTTASIVLGAPGLQAAPLVLTPGQTEGPFYPTVLPSDRDNDLVRVAGQAAEALGTVTLINGQVMDRLGQPVPGAVVEIWQCDANGVYRHPRAPGQSQIDHAFQGYGSMRTGADGRYSFRTIKPVPYPGRTPHIHFAVQVPGRGRLVTQMYVAGHPLNDRDGLLNSIRDPAARRSVIVPLEPASTGAAALTGHFDIVVDA